MVDSGVCNIVDEDKMASADDETLPIHPRLIQWLTNTTVVIM